MLKKEKISSKQVTYLLFITIISTAMIFLPARFYSVSKQDSWIAVILGGLFGILFAIIVSKLGIMYQDKTIIEYSQIILGKTLGKIIGLIFFLAFFYINIVVLREFSELAVGSFYPQTPQIFFLIAMILVSTYAVFQGLEVIARVNEIVFAIFCFLVLVLFFFNIPDMDFKQLAPILANGMRPVIKGAYSPALWYIELIVLTIFIPSLNIPTRAIKASVLSIVLIIILGTMTMIGLVAIFGQQTATMTFPFLSLGRFVNIANFLEQMDSFILLIWVSGVFIKITVFHYCTVFSLSQLLNLKDYKPIIWPLAVAKVVFAVILWNNTTQMIFQLNTYINNIYTIGIGGLIALLFIIAQIQRHLSQ